MHPDSGVRGGFSRLEGERLAGFGAHCKRAVFAAPHMVQIPDGISHEEASWFHLLRHRFAVLQAAAADKVSRRKREAAMAVNCTGVRVSYQRGFCSRYQSANRLEQAGMPFAMRVCAGHSSGGQTA